MPTITGSGIVEQGMASSKINSNEISDPTSLTSDLHSLSKAVLVSD